MDTNIIIIQGVQFFPKKKKQRLWRWPQQFQVTSALLTTCYVAKGSRVVVTADTEEVVCVVFARAVNTRITGTHAVVYKRTRDMMTVPLTDSHWYE